MAQVISLLAGGQRVARNPKPAAKPSPQAQAPDIKAALELALGALRAGYEARITLLQNELNTAREATRTAEAAHAGHMADLRGMLDAALEQATRLQAPAAPAPAQAVDLSPILTAIANIRIPEPAAAPEPPAYSLAPTGRDPNGRPLGYTLTPIKDAT